jgi:hypothetical protein
MAKHFSLDLVSVYYVQTEMDLAIYVYIGQLNAMNMIIHT